MLNNLWSVKYEWYPFSVVAARSRIQILDLFLATDGLEVK